MPPQRSTFAAVAKSTPFAALHEESHYMWHLPHSRTARTTAGVPLNNALINT